jgi:hypothetical protein
MIERDPSGAGGQRPIDDPIPEEPIIDEPGRVVPVVDPGRPNAPAPVREPAPAPGSPQRPGGGSSAPG